MNLSELRHIAKRYGVTINTNAPGDGVRRFEFASSEWGLLGRALGIREAEVWLNGFTAYADKVVDTEPYENPPYKGKLHEFPEDRFAYRGYSVRKRLSEEYWDISKEGFHIGGAESPEKAREIIADLTADTYRGEGR